MHCVKVLKISAYTKVMKIFLFSSRNITVLASIFVSLIHLDFFSYSTRQESMFNFFFSCMAIQLLQHHLLCKFFYL